MKALYLIEPRQVLVAFVMTALAIPVFAQDSPNEPEKLASLREAWTRAKVRDARPIKEKYLNALTKLRDNLTERNRLDDAVLVRSEIKYLAKVAEEGEELPTGGPAKLKELRKIYGREMERMAEGNDRKYVGALKKLGTSYSKARKLEAALAVRAEIEKVESAEVEFNGKFREFKEGARLFSNREYTWTKVPPEYSGYRVSFGAGKSYAPLRVIVRKGGVMRIVAEAEDVNPLKRQRWKPKGEAGRGGQRSGDAPPQVMEKVVEPGELKFETKTFLCVRLLLAPEKSE